MEPIMHKSSSQNRVFVPPINTVNMQQHQQHLLHNDMPLHEQASQTLKFCPSKESMTTTTQYRSGAPPPLPTKHITSNRPPNSERGLRDHVGLFQSTRDAQQQYQTGHDTRVIYSSHRDLNSNGDVIVTNDNSHQHFQSTSIEQNVLMFDQSQQENTNQQMASAFDHIQDELAKLTDQLQATEKQKPRKVQMSTAKNSSRQQQQRQHSSSNRVIKRTTRSTSANQKVDSQRQGSRSASRSRQQDAMNRLVSGSSSTKAGRQPQNGYQPTRDPSQNSRIKTHKRLNSTQQQATSANRLLALGSNMGTQESHRSLKRQKSGGSTRNLAERKNQFRSRQPKRTFDTIPQSQNPQAQTNDNHSDNQRHMGAHRSGSQRSFTNLPMRRLSRARSKSTKALGSQRSLGNKQSNYQTTNYTNVTQPVITRKQSSKKTQKSASNITHVYVPQPHPLASPLMNHTTGYVPQLNYTAQESLFLKSNMVDQTMITAPTRQYATNQPDMSSMINITTTQEPPQYLVAQSCETMNFTSSNSQQPPHDATAANGSQIEQIMARYEQLCRKLDQQTAGNGNIIEQMQGGAVVLNQINEQPNNANDANNANNANDVNHDMGASLDMYIQQHEESMMQESQSQVNDDEHYGNGEMTEGGRDTLESPARHIGPREYIEILSGKQDLLQRRDQHQIPPQTMNFTDQNDKVYQNYQDNQNESQQTTSTNHHQQFQSESVEAMQFAEAEALAELQARLANQESEINMAENHMVTASQFNQLSQVTEKEGTSHFQGIALTTSELNNYQDSSMAENKENDNHQLNVINKTNGNLQQQIQMQQYQVTTDDSQTYHLSSQTSIQQNPSNNLYTNLQPQQQQQQLLNTNSSKQQLGFQNQQRQSTVVSGQHTHAQASVTSYNTADFTKISINQNDILSNQKSSHVMNLTQGQNIPHHCLSSGNELIHGDQNSSTAVAMALRKVQDRAIKLEHGLKSAMEIILQLGRQLNETQGVDPLSNQLTDKIDELESIDSVVDLLAFMQSDKRNLLVRNPQIQRVVQNSFQLFSNQPSQTLQQSSERQPAAFKPNQNPQKPQTMDSHRYQNVPISDSDSKVFLQLERQSSSVHKPTKNLSNQATSPPFMRCATEMSGLIGSPVGVLDLSAVNTFSNQHNNNHHMAAQQIITSEKPGDQPPSMDTVKLVGVAEYNNVEPFETAGQRRTQQQNDDASNANVAGGHVRKNSSHVQAQADGQLLTLRNQKIFEADESNIFSQTMSPNAEQSRRQANIMTHLFSQEEESSISHHKTSGRQPGGQLVSCQENTGRGAELSFDSVFSKEPMQRQQNPQQMLFQAAAALPQVPQTAFQGYSPVILNRVSQISGKEDQQQNADAMANAYTTAKFVDKNKKPQEQSNCTSEADSARSSIFNAANQSLSQQELTDIMFASVRNPASLKQQYTNAAATNGQQDPADDGSNVGILTAMAQKRRQPSIGQDQNVVAGSIPAAMPWKSLNLSKITANDQNTRERFAPMAGLNTRGPQNLGLGHPQVENRRQKCYKDDGDNQHDDDLEEASRLLSLDDFAPNFVSQKPLSPSEMSAMIEANKAQQAGATVKPGDIQHLQTLVSFRNMTNRVGNGDASQHSQEQSSRADRVAAALIMSSGPDESTSQVSQSVDQQQTTEAKQLKDESGHSVALSQLDNARNKFLGGFSNLQSEISQLKQTIMDHN